MLMQYVVNLVRFKDLYFGVWNLLRVSYVTKDNSKTVTLSLLIFIFWVLVPSALLKSCDL